MSSSARSRSVAPQSTGDTQHNVRDAALIGASSAFARPAAKPQHLANTYTGGSNGALLAATKVGTGRSSTSAGTSVQRDYTGGSSQSVSRPHPSPKHVSSSSSLGVPDTHVDRAPSPSYTAAKLAAARLSPLRPALQAKAPAMTSERDANERDVLPPSGSVGSVLARLEPQKSSQLGSPTQQPRRRRGSVGSQSVADAASAVPRDKPTDDTPIPPTNSLVKMFEQNRPVTPTQPPAPSVVKNSVTPVESPKPRRNFTLPSEPSAEAPLAKRRTLTPPPVPKSKPSIEVPRPQFLDGTRETSRSSAPPQQHPPMKSPPIRQKPIQLAALNTKAITGPTTSGQGRPKSQDSRRSGTFHRRLSTSLDSNAPSSPSSFKSAKEEQEDDEKLKLAIPPAVEEEGKAKPALPPPRRSNTRKAESAPPDTKLPKPSVPPPRRQGKGTSLLQVSERLQPRPPPAPSTTTPTSANPSKPSPST
ncbi:hypothetical protein OPT61_g3838 [Boeremia exigua]|uniref:Uncharacterized protein n=1 Tax=Boeremia exigua TaxID=749465 RepID=A0ACC2IGD1_9PLEO|nr:hypothetical protein OPT61_g3838 [Boeremia exigua]